jgi:hypothetical protein
MIPGTIKCWWIWIKNMIYMITIKWGTDMTMEMAIPIAAAIATHKLCPPL